MKRKLLPLAIFCFSATLFAQDNTLPTTGNVGVGTLNPTERLEVNGNMRVDSSLIVNDSVRVNKTFRVMDKMFVEGKAVFGDKIVAKENLKVEGNTNLEGNLTVDSVFKLPNTSALSNNNLINGNFDFLLLNANGAARKADYETLLKKLTTDVYVPILPEELLTVCDLFGYLPTWHNGPNKIYTQCPDVKVGIGTEEPLFKLDVRGDGYFSKTIKLGTAYSPVTPAFIEGLSAPDMDLPWVRMTTEENNVKNTVFLVNNDGGLYCTSARVRLKEDIPVPDFVFQPDYALMPLNEVKDYVQTHSHLPGIPSEAEIRAEGLNLEEMQLKLLQKIEELTLYVIELDEKNKVLEAELETLKTAQK